jgi:catechol 2,3-dioxygenase-like lactoylglutathione lyase family enzyme
VSLTAIDHVQLAAPAGCEDAARAFFGQLLGLRELPKPPAVAPRGGVWFAVGSAGQQLHIGVTAEYARAHKAHPAFRATDLDALAQRLSAAGHEVRWDTELPGVRRFYVNDPWGNRLELLTQASQSWHV